MAQDPVERRARNALRAGLFLLGILALLFAGSALLQYARDWLHTSDAALAVDQYLHLRGLPPLVDAAPLDRGAVLALATSALSLESPATRDQVVLLVASLVVLLLWLLGGALRPGRLRAAGAGLAIGLVAIDLLAMTLTFHPYGEIARLRPRLPEVLTRPADAPFRVYTPPTAADKTTQVEPNRLLVAGLEEANGYSSLEPDRLAAYVDAVQYLDNQLLDLWNVRFRINRIGPQLFPSYAGVVFHPERPLVSGRGSGAAETLLPEGGDVRASELRIVARLAGAAAIANDTPVATIRLEGPNGEVRSLPVLAGRDVSDTAIDVPGSTRVFQHRIGTVAFQFQRTDPAGGSFGQQIYAGSINVEPPMAVSRVSVLVPGPASIEIYGLGLVDPGTQEVTQVRDKAKYRLAYTDSEIRVQENANAMPRAFVVANAVLAQSPRDALDRMRDGTVDVRRTAILECGSQPSCGVRELPHTDTPPRMEDVGSVRITSRTGDQMALRASADRPAVLVLADPYFPGWEAQVDGRPTPVLRANYLFRAILLPPGDHQVTFVYQPLSLAVGLGSTVATACLLLIFFAVPEVARLRRWVRTTVPGSDEGAHRWRLPIPWPGKHLGGRPATDVAGVSGEAP
jgi:hypothetical protein